MIRRFVVSRQLACSAAARMCSTGMGALPQDAYERRHIGPTDAEATEMLRLVGFNSMGDFMNKVIPAGINRPPLADVPALSEKEALAHLRAQMARNRPMKSLIGQGYYEAITPPAIQRNVLENPNWYTPYTPYQAEISQGRLESLLNYQTVVAELTGMPVANASLLDQATAAAEAMYLAMQKHNGKRKTLLVSPKVFASTLGMLRTRADPLGFKVVVADPTPQALAEPDVAGVLVQTPDAEGCIIDATPIFAEARKHGVISICGTDLLASCIVKPPGEMGADVVYGSAQRFGIPLGYGGPHAAFFAVREDLVRLMPGRLIGISKDAEGNRAIRMALATREQHIRREKATSNVCTAQALLANMNAFYAVYHGAEGLRTIASEVHAKAKTLAVGFESAGLVVTNPTFFDTLTVKMRDGLTAPEFVKRCADKGINIFFDPANAGTVSVSIDEATTPEHIAALLEAAGLQQPNVATIRQLADAGKAGALPAALRRTTPYLEEPVFKVNRSESGLMRYIQRLARKDYGLTHGAIPLGSCTMKLNAAATMLPMSWPELNGLHPLVPEEQARGYASMCTELEQRLKDITGFAAVSLQPNSGAQGEYAGLRTIRAYHASKNEGHRNICLIPQSAHGTNPASAVLCGMRTVTVACLPDGRIDLKNLRELCAKHAKELSCIMCTYPSTYGVFDSDIATITSTVHEHGGQVYIDGANFNAMVGYTGPAFFGGDVCHINLHKTFSIPHGGGGPGMGPIGVREHLAPFLPNTTYGPKVGGSQSFGQTSQAAYGSASILSISYMLMLMLGSRGLTRCTEYAVLNANYLRKRLDGHYKALYLGDTGLCAHEFIIDLRPFKASANIEAEDVAKRLMDYGFHAPTLAFPVAGTLMIEPTESEPKEEIDRLADALISIRGEIAEIEQGKQPREGNVLKNSPHTARLVTAAEWTRPYSRQTAAFPSPYTRLVEKYWPTVSRIDGTYGDRHLMCSCAGMTSSE